MGTKLRHAGFIRAEACAMERLAAGWIETSLKLWVQARDALVELFLLAFDGSPLPQSLVGLSAENSEPRGRIERDLAREADADHAFAELESAIGG